MADRDMPKPSSNEDEYFAKENAEKLRKLALDRSRALEQSQRDDLKKLHWMHCPKCGMEMQAVQFRGVEIDRCFNCGATVFDAGELEKLGVSESESGSVMRSIINIFK